jgi:hypothetical protein
MKDEWIGSLLGQESITCLGDVYTQFGYIRVGAWVDMITHILLSYQLYTST